MKKGIQFLPNPSPRLWPYYLVLHILSFLFLISGSVFLAIVIKNYLSGSYENTSILIVTYFLFTVLSLIFSGISIMARTGARWKHISHYTVVLPVSGMLIPAVGTIICIYCLRKISGTMLPQLTLAYKEKRGGTRPPDMNPKIYHQVRLHGSSFSGICALSVIIVTHIIFIVSSIVINIKK